MSDAAIKEQTEAATAAAEVQPVEETAAAVEKTDDGVENTKNGEEKKAEKILKTTARINHKDFKQNRKYDPTTQPVSDDPVKIRAQVCYTPPQQDCFARPRPD
jgi:lupus La protein